MTTARICNNCNGPKPDDRFRACPSCRAMWRAKDHRRRGRPLEALRRTVAIDSDVLATIADDCLTGAILDDEDRITTAPERTDHGK